MFIPDELTQAVLHRSAENKAILYRSAKAWFDMRSFNQACLEMES